MPDKEAKVKKKIICWLLAVFSVLSFTACSSSEEELAALYSSSDNVVNTDIGEYIIGQNAPLFTEGKLCYITEGQLSKDENLSCASALLIDVTNNRLIQGQDIYKKVFPASITKLMTAYIVLKYGNVDDMYTVKEDDCGITEEGAQLIGFKKGDVVKVKDLLYCLLVYSGNDSASALADYISGSETAFCELMNTEAQKLGCNSTNYLNPHGLHDENHYTSAYDVYIVLQACMKYDLFREITQTNDYEFSHKNAQGEYDTVTFSTTNRFKTGKYTLPEGIMILGCKTGTTYSAGSCLVQYFSDAQGNEYIAEVFGAQSTDDLYTQMAYLLQNAIDSNSSNDISGTDWETTPETTPEAESGDGRQTEED